MHTEVTTESKNMITTDSSTLEKAVQQEKLNDSQNDRSSYDKNDRNKKKFQNDGKDYQQNTSPRRNNTNNNNRYNNRILNYHNGNRQNRNSHQQQYSNTKQRFDTNNNSNHKMQQQQQQQCNYNNLNNYNAKILTPTNGKCDYQEVINSQVKKPIPKHRIIKASSASPNYDANKQRVDTQMSNGDKHHADDSGINLNTSVNNMSNSEARQKYHQDHLMAGDNESINRKYSIEFLHQVGHQYKISANSIVSPNHVGAGKTPSQNQNQQKVIDDNNLIALKMALGDNSGYYNNLYSGGAMYTNQIFFQQHQQYQQTYARFQQQHIQQQRMRMFPRQDNNYQRIYQQDPMINRQQCTPQQNSIDQRSYHNAYYQQQHHNSFQYQQNRAKQQNRDQNRKNRQNNNNSSNNNNNNNNHSTNERNSFNNKKYNDQNGRVSHSKSDSNAQYEEPNRKNLMYIRTNSEEFRSLSPTPPSSVKSSSPGIHEKNCVDSKEIITTEFNDDSASTTSTQSAMSYTSDNNKELSLTPTILLTPNENDCKENSVNSWINNNIFTPINNGLSASAEQLRHVETPLTIIKRPPSAGGISSSNLSHSIPRNYSLPAYDPTYPFDYYFAREERCEMRDEPISLCCGSIYDHVSQEIWDKFQVFQQTRETYRSKMMLWRDLYEFIRGFPLFQQRACPKWGLFLVGSTISGFGLDSSDVDMCLVLKTAPQLDPRTEAMITLSALKDYLISSGSTFQGFYLINAKVPILRFRDSTNTIEVDLNYNNCIGVRNTHLLYCYAQLDWRLRPLAIIVKLWAQYHNINDARNSTISSYSLVLMVIHFLQSAVSPPILPCLHQKYPEKFQVLHDITTIDMMEHIDTNWRSENYQSLGELFLRFLDYYSNFDYIHHAISIRTGGVLSIEECRSVKTPKNDPNHWQTLCIEEPFDLTNTARSTYDGEIFEKIKNVFFQSWRLLREYKSLASLFQERLFVQQASQQHQMHNTLTNQMLNDSKFMIYTPYSSPIITTHQMNAEITS